MYKQTFDSCQRQIFKRLQLCCFINGFDMFFNALRRIPFIFYTTGISIVNVRKCNNVSDMDFQVNF